MATLLNPANNSVLANEWNAVTVITDIDMLRRPDGLLAYTQPLSLFNGDRGGFLSYYDPYHSAASFDRDGRMLPPAPDSNPFHLTMVGGKGADYFVSVNGDADFHGNGGGDAAMSLEGSLVANFGVGNVTDRNFVVAKGDELTVYGNQDLTQYGFGSQEFIDTSAHYSRVFAGNGDDIALTNSAFGLFRMGEGNDAVHVGRNAGVTIVEGAETITFDAHTQGDTFVRDVLKGSDIKINVGSLGHYSVVETTFGATDVAHIYAEWAARDLGEIDAKAVVTELTGEDGQHIVLLGTKMEVMSHLMA